LVRGEDGPGLADERERGKSLRMKGRVDINNRVEGAKTRLLRKREVGAYISEK